MRHPRWHPLHMAVVVAPLILAVGCAKSPTMTTAAAPAPTAQASGTLAPGNARPVSSGSGLVKASNPNPAMRPAPSEFRATDALKDIHFDFDRYAIRPADRSVLDANAAWMKANPKTLVLIEGHADERGTDEYNQALGDRRAKATQNYLVAHGIAAGRISTISYGEERPLCTEHNDGCWARNRRSHFLVKSE